MNALTTTVKETLEHKGYTIDLTTEFYGDRISGQRAVVIVSADKKLAFTDIKTAKDFATMLHFQKVSA